MKNDIEEMLQIIETRAVNVYVICREIYPQKFHKAREILGVDFNGGIRLIDEDGDPYEIDRFLFMTDDEIRAKVSQQAEEYRDYVQGLRNKYRGWPKEKEARREQYLKLKEEFENDPE